MFDRTRPMRFIAPLVLLVAMALPAQAQDQGCDIETSSYVVVKPPTRRPSPGPIVAAPQTPCPTLPNQWGNAIGPIDVGIDLQRPRRRTPLPDGRGAGVRD